MIFTTRVGTPLDPSDIARRFTGLLDHGAIRRVRFHHLRHTCGAPPINQLTDVLQDGDGPENPPATTAPLN